MTKMRAKMRVGSITPFSDGNGSVSQEKVTFHGVAKSSSYPNDGADEDNTYAKFSPSAVLDIVIANPALIGQFETGETFYVDFTPVG